MPHIVAMPPVQESSSAFAGIVRDPAYQQLHGLLRGLIRSGDYTAGSKFPTERAVAARFGVSRVTANKALAGLVAEGVLDFKKGVGTFVRDPGMDYDLRSLMSFTRKAELSGKIPQTVVRKFSTVKGAEVGPGVRAALEVGDADSLHFVERLRSTDGVPVILERRFLVSRHTPRLRLADVAGSLYTVLTERFGLHLSGSDQIIRAVNLDAKDASILGVKSGGAAVWVHAVGYCEHGPLWLEDTLYRGDRYEFHNSLGSHKAARPARAALSPIERQQMIAMPAARSPVRHGKAAARPTKFTSK